MRYLSEGDYTPVPKIPQQTGVPARPGFLSVAQVAERTGVCKATVRRWINSGKLRASQFGKTPRSHYRIEICDFEAFLEDGICQGRASHPDCIDGPGNDFGTSSTARIDTRRKQKIARKRNDG